jgi:hypothetical protein
MDDPSQRVFNRENVMIVCYSIGHNRITNKIFLLRFEKNG